MAWFPRESSAASRFFPTGEPNLKAELLTTPPVKTCPVPDLSSLKLVHLALSSDVPQIRIARPEGAAKQSLLYLKPSWRRSLGQGGFCEVTTHEITDDLVAQTLLSPGTIVAIKRYLRRSDLSLDSYFRNIYHEVRRDVTALCHPTLRKHENIAKLLFIGWEDSYITPVLAFELAQYGTLEDFLSGAKPGSVTDVERFVLTWDISSGLKALHDNGFVHRDLKPANILVGTSLSNTIKAVISDFSGSMTLSNSGAFDNEGHVSRIWTSPEESPGRPQVGDFRKCDIYSFGLLIATLWIEDYHRPGHPVRCFLVNHLPGVGEEAVLDAIDSLKQLPDEDEGSPRSIASSRLRDMPLVGEVICDALRLNPQARPSIGGILHQLHIDTPAEIIDESSNEQTAWEDDRNIEKQLDCQAHEYKLLSTFSPFRKRSKLFQQTMLQEMYRLADPLKGCLVDTIEEFSASGGFWEELEKLSERIRSRPFSCQGNQTVATLTFDIALCHWFQLGTSANEDAGRSWLEVSAKLGNDWAMSMYTPFCCSMTPTPNTSPCDRLWLILSCLKGFKPSKRWLKLYFPQDYTMALEAAKTRFAQGQSDSPIEDHSDLPLDLWSEEIELASYNRSGDLHLVCQIASQQVKDFEGLQSSLSHDCLQTNLPWSADAFVMPPHRRHPSNSPLSPPPYLLYTAITHCSWGFDHAVASVRAMFKDLPGPDREDAVASIMSVTLWSCLSSYWDQENLLTYRWELGALCHKQHLKQLNALMEAGANPFRRFKAGVVPFVYAMLANDAAALREMQKFAPHYGIDLPLWLETIGGHFWLLKSLEKGCHKTLDYFLAEGWCSVNQKFASGADDTAFKTGPQDLSLLHLAATVGFPESVLVLLRHGADIFSTTDMNGLTPFTRALVEGNLEVAKLLLPEAEDDRKRIFNSLSHNHFNCFGTVLSAAQATLGSSWERGNITIETFQLLEDLGKNVGAVNFIVNPRKGTNVYTVFLSKWTILGSSSSFNTLDDEIFDFLLEHFHEPHQINCRDSEGFPPLHSAVCLARSSTVLQMLRWKETAQLDINAKWPATGGVTALDAAVRLRDNVPEHILRGGAREITVFYDNMKSIISKLKAHGAKGGENVSLNTWAATYRELHGQTNIVGVHINSARNTPGLSTKESISHWMSQVFAKVFDPDIDNSAAALDKYIGEWPKQWGKNDEDAAEGSEETAQTREDKREAIKRGLLEHLVGGSGSERGEVMLDPDSVLREFELPLPEGFNLNVTPVSQDLETSALMPRLVDNRGEGARDLGPLFQSIQEALRAGQPPNQSQGRGPLKFMLLDLSKNRK